MFPLVVQFLPRIGKKKKKNTENAQCGDNEVTTSN